MSAQHTPGPWELCQHLRSMECDQACPCGYRGVIYGPEHDVAMAICQPGHQPAPAGEEGTEPCRYPRDVELANARLIAAAPELLGALEKCRDKFAEYATLHLAKGTRDGILKAQANADMANLVCGAAIAKATGAA